jgi:hypothetical protein
LPAEDEALSDRNTEVEAVVDVYAVSAPSAGTEGDQPVVGQAPKVLCIEREVTPVVEPLLGIAAN